MGGEPGPKCPADRSDNNPREEALHELDHVIQPGAPQAAHYGANIDHAR
jgi:hypothetical protein